MIRAELDLCGYFAIISSEKMDAKKAITLYKNRDASEKYFVQINLTWVIIVCELFLRKLHQIKYLLDLLP